MQHPTKHRPDVLYRVNRRGDVVRDTRPRNGEDRAVIAPATPSSPARQKYKAERAARRAANSPRAKAAAIHAAAVKAVAATPGDLARVAAALRGDDLPGAA